MTDLPPELSGQQAQTTEQPQASSFRDTIGQLAVDPVEKFMAELLSVVDETSDLDSAFKDPSVEEELDLQDPKANPLDALNIEQITKLVDLFMAIPTEQRSQIYNEVAKVLPPTAMRTIDAAIRLGQGKGASPQDGGGP